MMLHKESSEFAGQTVRIINSKQYKGCQYQVEDWWDKVSGKSWMAANGNPACLEYAMRTGLQDEVPTDDEVLYGKIDGLGHLFHITEVEKGE